MTLRRLRFIRAAHAVGLTLEGVQALLGTGDGCTPSCREVQALVDERLEEIERWLKDREPLAKCRASERPGCCHVIETLDAASSSRE